MDFQWLVDGSPVAACISPRTGQVAWALLQGQALGVFLQSWRSGAGGPGKTNRFFTINTDFQRLVSGNTDVCRFLVFRGRKPSADFHHFFAFWSDWLVGVGSGAPGPPPCRPACGQEPEDGGFPSLIGTGVCFVPTVW